MRTPRRSRPTTLSRFTPLAAALASVLVSHQVFGACTPIPQTVSPDPIIPAPVYCVTNTNASGAGSLAQAVLDSHARCQGTSPTINFDLPGTGPFVFNVPLSGFSFNCGVGGAFNPTIDGGSQPGFSANSDPTGFNAVNPIVFSGGGNSSTGLSHDSGFSYGGRLTVKAVDLRDFYYTSYGGPCSSFAPAALQGPVTVAGSRFINSCYGVIFQKDGGTSPSVIGGASPADRNVFGGIFVDAIINTMYGGSAHIENNFVGTLDGVTSGGGGGKGIYLYGDGSTLVYGNVISGNTGPAAIYLSIAANVTIENNKIGPAANGTTLGNSQDGIRSDSTYDILIKDNLIAYNGRDGVNVLNGSGVDITGNEIFGNGRKSINLGDAAAPLPNDPGDSDEGANSLQNFPTINSVVKDAANLKTHISWSLDSTPATNFNLQFFANPAASAFPQATTIIGGTTATTPGASPFVSGTTSVSGLHDFISATATDSLMGNTSEVGAAAVAKGVDLAPATLNFGNVVVGDTSAVLAATLSSLGSANATINQISGTSLCYGGPAPICGGSQFSCTTTCSIGTFTGGTSCSFTASFSPIALGPQTTTIYICDDAGGNPARSLTITGNAVAPPPATLLPSSHDFGAIEIGGFSSSKSFTITNPGPLPITLTAPTVSGPFPIQSNSCGATLAATSSCTVVIKFTPSAVGAASGTLSTTASTGTLTASLAGTGTAGPPPTLTPPSTDFGAVTVGNVSSFATFTLTNPALTSIAVGSFTVTAPFVLGPVVCSNPLPAGASCTAQVKFQPSAPGPASGTISVGASGITLSSTLAGSGSSIPVLQVSPAAHDFGSVLVGASSAAKGFTITNPSASSTSLSVAVGAPFQIVNSTCGTSLAAGGSCSVNVTFVPTVSGFSSLSLMATSSAGSSSASLSGNGVREPGVSMPTSTIEFGSMVVNSASVLQTIQLNSTGNTTLGINNIAISPPFTYTTTCGVSLAQGDACNITVGFNPTVVGDFTGFLSVSTNAPGGSSLQAPLHAGVQQRPEPIIQVAPLAINFGARFAGSPAPTQNVTVRNDGGSIATLDITLDVPNFSIIQSGCGATLAPGASCGIELGFSPQGFGPKQGSLVIRSNAPNSPQAVGLSGAGCRPVTFSQNRGGASVNCSP